MLLPFLSPLLALSAQTATSEALAGTADILITSVSIVRVEDGTASPPMDILVADGRIAKVAEAGTLAAPRDVPVVDGSGSYALPGLIDVHAHIGDGGAGSQTDADRDRAMARFPRYGVTTIFVAGGSGANDDQMIEWRRRCAAREVVCPGLYGSGAILTAPGSHPITTLFGLPADADAATTYAVGLTAVRPGDDLRGLIASKVAKGADAIKIVIEDGPPPWYPKPRLGDAEIAALVEAAHAVDVPVYAHVGRAEHVVAGLEGGIDGIMHSPLEPLPQAVVEAMASEDVFYVATLALYDGIADWTSGRPEDDPFALAGITPRSLATLRDPGFLAAAPETEAGAAAYIEAASDNVRRAAAAGVPMALGTDTNNPFVYPGYSAHEELALLVDAGLTPAEALKAATVGGAAFLRREESLGRIAEEFEADILILAANPLDDILNTRTLKLVISDGRIVEDSVPSSAPR